MKKSKRILVFFATFCLLLSMIVPTAWAEETEGKVVKYDFDIFAVIADIEKDVEGADQLPEKYRTDSGYDGYRLKLNDGKTELQSLYSQQKLNWTYTGQYVVDAFGSFNAVFYNKDYTKQNKNYPERDSGFLRISAGLGDWIAFTIKNPGVDTNWHVSMNHITSKQGAEVCNVYILPGSTTKEEIVQTLGNAENGLVGDVCFYTNEDTISADCPYIASTASSVGVWKSGEEEEYIVVLQTAKKHSEATGAYLYLSQLVMESAVAKVGDTVYTDETQAINAINAATSGTVQLLDDITTASTITLNSGVTLDLNGKTLDATVVADQGILTDSSNGAGKIANTATFDAVGDKEVVLADGEYYRVFDYDLKEVETVRDGDTVRFWFDVTLSDAAYAVIAHKDNDSQFDVGATLQWNTNTPVPAEYGENMSVKAWAGLMLDNPSYYFYVEVVGLNSAKESGILTVMPTVSGQAGGGSLATGMTCTVEAAQ